MNTKDSIEVEADIARAWTLPARLYTDADIFATEKEKIFSRTWQVVGHASQVANPGDYSQRSWSANRCFWCGVPMENCAASTTCAGIAPGRRRRVAVRASCFDVAITVGRMGSTERC